MSQSLFNKFWVLFAAAIMISFMFSAKNLRRPFGADALGYYMYLPSTLIYHNNKSLEKLPLDKKIPTSIIADAAGMSPSKTPLGYTRNAYTYGVALMELPFFLMAHGWERLKGTEANGYSESYIDALFICDIFYVLVGLFFVFKILNRYFTQTLSSLSIIALYLGTNLFWFTIFQEGMSHVPLFCLYAVLIYATIRIHEKPTSPLFLVLGFTAGLITLIRPSDIICLLIPLLYNVYNREAIKQKLSIINNNPGKILVAGCAFMLPVIPQMIYWKLMAGSFVYYSYGNQQFNWTNPQILDGMIGAHNGWLAYTPLMFIALIGMFFYKKIKPWSWCLWILLPIYVYIIYSWYCYTYINGFGSRPMIHLYPLLAIPLAAMMQLVSKQKMVIKSIAATIFLFLISVNLGFSWQQSKGILNTELSNWTYNLHILFKTRLSYNDLVTYDIAETQPDSSGIKKIETLAYENFNDSVTNQYLKDTTGHSGYVYHMINEDYGPKGISIPFSKTRFAGAKYCKCSGRFMYPVLGGFTFHYMVFTINDYKWCACKIENKIDILDGSCKAEDITLNHFLNKKWGYVSFFVKLPPNIPEGKAINFFIWDPQHCELYIDDLSLEIYK